MAVHRGPRLRRHPQPLEHRPHPGRLLRRLGGRRRRRSGPRRARLGRRRLGPHPGRLDPSHRHQAAARPRSPPGRAPSPSNGITVNGPLARTVADAALLLDAASGNHDGDLHRPPAVDVRRAVGRDPGRLRIALRLQAAVHRRARTACDPEVRAAVVALAETLAALGHDVEEAEPRYGQIGLTFVPRATAGIAEWARAPRPRAARPAHPGRRPPGPAPRRGAAARWPGAPRPCCTGVSARSSTVRRGPRARPRPLPRPRIGAMRGWAACHRPRDDRRLPLRLALERPGLARRQRPRRASSDGLPVGAQLLGPANSEPLLISLAAQLEADQRWYERWP